MKLTVVANTTPRRYWARVLAGVGVILILDAVWLSIMTSTTSVYKPLTESATPLKAGIGIVLYAIVAACVAGVFESNSHKKAATVGALLGFLVFSVYNLTTFATIDGWEALNAFIDTGYGTVVWTILLVTQHAVSVS